MKPGTTVVLKTGRTLPAIAARRGDYEDWIVTGLGISADAVLTVDVERGETPPDDDGRPAAIVVTGSSAMVTQRLPWSVAAGHWLHAHVQSGVPVLAICYGHQLLADAAGGEVGSNPNGREIGTIEVSASPEAADDPLFGALPERMVFQATHRESVLRLPPGAQRLARNAHDANQAFAFGKRAWAVQFHPEFDAAIVRGYIEARTDALRQEGLDPEPLLRRTHDTDHGPRLLRRFSELAGLKLST